MKIFHGILLCGLFSNALFAAQIARLGTPSAFLSKLKTETLRPNALLSLPTISSSSVNLRIQEIRLEEDYVSMIGIGLESPTSEFILKGNGQELYGWVVQRDLNMAFEYTTNAFGELQVEQVSVEKIFPVCNFNNSNEKAMPIQMDFNVPALDSIHPHIGDYDGVTDVNKLQSIKGATKVLYIDITAIQSKAKVELYKLWQAQSAAFSAFQVNVTTDPAVYAAAGTANSGVSKFINQSGRSSCGLNSWGTTRSCTLYLDGSGDGYSMGRTTVHETGHQMGLGHDGGSNGGEYFNGFSAFKWTPIMGNYWPGNSWGAEALYQWCKGEYTSATRTEDDLDIIGRKIPLKPDDFPGTASLAFQGTKVPGAINRGRLGPNDQDVFAFEVTTAGNANLKINRIEYLGGSMLDIDASILNAAGTSVLRDNKNAIRGAALTGALPIGKYTLVIKGGAEGTPANGFSNYSSIGFYSIDGEITGAIGTGILTPMRHSSQFKTLLSGKTLNIQFSDRALVSSISLRAIDGKPIFHTNNAENKLDLSRLTAGIYLLQVKINGKISAESIFIP